MAASEKRQLVTPEKVREIVSSFFSEEKSSSRILGDNENGEGIPQESTSENRSINSSLELRSKEAYFNRIETYSPLTWFAKPLELSPLICAQYGWENSEKDTLQCIGCKASFSAHLPTVDDPTYKESCETIKKKLLSSHMKTCSWSSNPSSDFYKRIPTYDHKEVRKDFKERLEQLKKITDSLPHVSYDSLEKWNLSSSRCAQLAYQIEKMDTSPIKAATSLAVTGWANKGKADVIVCSYCRRHVGLWNFRSIAPSQDTDTCPGHEDSSGEPAAKRQKTEIKSDFDPVAEHRYWCPWITINSDLPGLSVPKPIRAETGQVSSRENGSGSSLSSVNEDRATDPAGQPGWLLVVKILAPRLLDSTNISFSKSLKQSPVAMGLRSIRHLFSDWTTPAVTNS